MKELDPTPAFDAHLPPIRTDLTEATADLDQFGFTRFFDGTAQSGFQAAATRIKQLAAAEIEQGIAQFEDPTKAISRHGHGTNQRIRGLVAKDEIFRKLIENDAFEHLMAHLLGEDFLLSSLAANIVGPGALAGPMHTDSFFAPDSIPFPIVANCVWMLNEFTVSNGATRIVPASHLRPRAELGVNAERNAVDAIGPAGTMMVFDGRLWHSTGANRSDNRRLALISYCCLPWVRQQENPSLTIAPQLLEQCSAKLKARLGFRIWHTLGRGDEPGVHGEMVTKFSAGEER